MMTDTLVPLTAQTTSQDTDELTEAGLQPSVEEIQAARELVRQARDGGVSLTGPQAC